MFSDQQDLLVQFQTITDASIPEEEQIQLLEAANWNLELAILNYFQLYPREANNHLTSQIPTTTRRSSSMSSGSRGQQIGIQDRINNFLNQFVGESQEPNTMNMPGAFPTDESITTSSRQQPSKLFKYLSKAVSYTTETVVFLIVLPLFTLYKVLGFLLLILVGLIVPIIMKIQPMKYKTVKRGCDPGDVARRFIMKFDDFIGNRAKSHLNENPLITDELTDTDSRLISQNQLLEIERPDFLECAYSQALYFAKKEYRWLLVYIHSDQNEDTPSFVNDILINKTFLQFIKEKEILIWGGDITDSESFQIANQFKINKLPFLGLLCLTVHQTPTASGVQQSAPLLSIFCKIQGLGSTKTPEANIQRVMSKLQRAYNKFNPTLVTLRAEYERQNESRNMRRVQDQAYENSLKRDKLRKIEKERQLKEAADRKKLQELEIQWLKWRKSVLLPEAIETGTFARVAIRLPNGTRIQHKFPKTASIEEIYAFVECECLGKDIEIDNDDMIQRPIGYVHEYKFNINSVYPRETLQVDSDTLIETNGLVYPNGNLIVEMITDDN
ncbi:hypothetical protein CANARDRAFT_28713 [[Candida] arabinofermentans NRRL YB-2248]|uniref:UBX domain-containing protein n=1 Tax=[Candida] arabinofermentans NRRL YB-2248 TaxID=983967 RepID=A0A1E4SZU7_9ASCO|nr:hypothetical protein CANARDRAFT_28713 [[Candida] arabinofermentans NRRL YB-2248]